MVDFIAPVSDHLPILDEMIHDGSSGYPKWIWCLVANVTREPHPEGLEDELRLGLKRFAPGAKLYCFRSEWSDGGERLRVLGRHRSGGSKLIKAVISTRWLTNWRPQKVFHPYVIHSMKRHLYGWDNSERSREIAVEMAEWFKDGLRGSFAEKPNR
jgi:hypothetical protein